MGSARAGWAVVGTLALAGCGHLPPGYVANPQALRLQPIVITQNSSGPLSYQPPDVGDANASPEVVRPRQVVGEACQSGFELPWIYSFRGKMLGYVSAGWGNGAYQEAMARAQAQVGPDDLLYDVRADLRHTSVLSIWRQLCLVVTANAAPRRVAAAAGAMTPTPEPSHAKDRL